MEDGLPIGPLNTTVLDIIDEETDQLRRAILTIQNDGITVNDSLFAEPSGTFNVTGNGTTELVIDPSPGHEFLTTQDQFEEYLRAVTFTTDDQAPSVVRNLTLIVGKLPNAMVTSSPAIVPITVIAINDQPVLLSSRVSESILDDYLPPEVNNLGFLPSYLLSEMDVVDVDRSSPISNDIVGLAITEAVSGGVGTWQYWYNGSWVNFPAISDCFPLLVEDTTRVRFWPSPSLNKEDGNASITYRAWDGTDRVFCDNETVLITTEGMNMV